MKITEVLQVEHATFLSVVAQIERSCQQIESLREVNLLADLVESFLNQHESKEIDTVFAAYDHVLRERGLLKQLTQDHERVDEQILKLRRTTNIDKAKRLLESILVRVKRHFRFEEETVFPIIEQVLEPDTLETLART